MTSISDSPTSATDSPTDPESDRRAGKYRIGAVSELTGISPENLRAWERRYGAVTPVRADSGFRLYSDDDLERLLLIKRLLEHGNSVGNVATLSFPELEQRIARLEQAGRLRPSGPTPAPRRAGPIRLAIADAGLSAQLKRGRERIDGFRVVLDRLTIGELIEDLEETPAEVALVDLAALGEDPEATVKRLLDETELGGIVVHYHFARRALLRRLATLGARLYKGSIQLETLALVVRDVVAGGPLSDEELPTAASSGPNPRREFTNSELAQLREVTSAVKCECPNHLSAIIEGLVAFEQYSLTCRDETAEDAKVHAMLYRETGRARMVMERALRSLVEHEGIKF